MKFYIDLFLLLNFFIDFLLLISISYILKRKICINKLLISAFIGSLSSCLLFVNIDSYLLVLAKVTTNVLMQIIAFNFNDLKYLIKNVVYFYIISILLCGSVYLLKVNSYLLLIIYIPIILIIFIYELGTLKNKYNNYYRIKIYLKDKTFQTIAFLDTGNMLTDPYTNKPIMLVENNSFFNDYAYLLVPYNTIDNHSLIRCIKPTKIEINGILIKKKVLIGLLNKKINIDGVGCILNERILEP